MRQRKKGFRGTDGSGLMGLICLTNGAPPRYPVQYSKCASCALIGQPNQMREFTSNQSGE